jgi:hypothetical protein
VLIGYSRWIVDSYLIGYITIVDLSSFAICYELILIDKMSGKEVLDRIIVVKFDFG